MQQVVLGMVGAGRGTELHMGGYARVHGIDLRLKKISDLDSARLDAAVKRYGFEEGVSDYEDLLRDPEINLIDICTPPFVHAEIAIKALNAGKNVICEKPLAGYFGQPGDPLPIGSVSKKQMFDKLMEQLDLIKEAEARSGKHFMYAENFVYAPAVQRAAEIVSAKKNRILYLKGEESLKGSSSAVAGEWAKNGGGTLMRVGSHPLGAAIYLKQVEAAARGVDISLASVLADATAITPSLTDYEHRHIAARPHDVEDICTAIYTFSDGSRAVIMATDVLLGGSKNYVELYCNDATVYCNLTLSNLMQTYLLDEDGLDNVSLSEMLPTKCGWNNPFVVDEICRGYTDEMQDFCEAVAYDREAKSNFRLAYDATRAMYAAYYSAEQGRKIDL